MAGDVVINRLNSTALNKIIGNWHLAYCKINPVGDYRYMKMYSRGYYVWEILRSGTITESISGKDPVQLKYFYDRTGRLLAIGRDEKMKYYRVEFVSDLHMMLYDLHEVEVEPDDYTLSMELEKVMLVP